MSVDPVTEEINKKEEEEETSGGKKEIRSEAFPERTDSVRRILKANPSTAEATSLNRTSESVRKALSVIGYKVHEGVHSIQHFNNHTQLRRLIEAVEKLSNMLKQFDDSASLDNIASEHDFYKSEIPIEYVYPKYRSTRAEDEFDGLFDADDDLDEGTLGRRLMNSFAKQIFKTVLKKVTGGGGKKSSEDERLKAEIDAMKEDIKKLTEMMSKSGSIETKKSDVHQIVESALNTAAKSAAESAPASINTPSHS